MKAVADMGGAMSTGHRELDDLLAGGMRASCTYTVTGYPGVGTSTFALGLARSVAIRQGLPTLYLSAQSPANMIAARVLAAEARVALHWIIADKCDTEAAERIQRHSPVIANAPLVIDDHPYRDFRAVEQLLIDGYGEAGEPWKLVVVDGTNILARPTAPEQLWAAHTRVSADIKRAARDTGAAFVITTPTNRRADNRLDPSPTLPDIASSNSYAGDADVVIGIHRPDHHELESLRPGEADLVVLKSRYTATRTVLVAFQGHYARFVDLAN